MANDIIITRTNPTPTLKLRVKNMDVFTIDLDQPVSPFKIPEESGDNAQIIKVEGNFMQITLSWVLLDHGSDLSDGTPGSIQTPDEQFNFLLNTFENKGLNYKYTIEVESLSPVFSKSGTIAKTVISKDAQEPNNYRCTLNFFVGQVIISAEDTSP